MYVAVIMRFGVLLVTLGAAQSKAAVLTDDNVGYFWHVTDLHWDPTYGGSSVTPGVSCGKDAPPSGNLGNYGDYACDSPWTLINDSIYAMKAIKPDVDFIIWTGDDTPHNADISPTDVAAIIGNLTNKLLECFPNTTTFPVLGNHDWSPKHQLPPRPDPFYDLVADLWTPWIREVDPLADASFRQSGYYKLQINANLLLVGLNTNLYYKNDALTDAMPDPACQFQWLDDVLTSARFNNTKVLLIGHVPPGQFEKHNNTNWFRPFFNDVFLQLLRKHSDVIGSAHFAHHHTDSFRIVTDETGNAVTSLLIAPSVTPWETTLPGVMGGAGNNPSIRLVRYNRLTGQALDIEQFYLDLVAANSDQRSNWTLAYRLTTYLGCADAGTASLAALATSLWTDDDKFGKYYSINDVYYENSTAWTREERIVHCCAILNVDYNKYGECWANNTISPPVANYTVWPPVVNNTVSPPIARGATGSTPSAILLGATMLLIAGW